jgi:hypothetical protein
VPSGGHTANSGLKNGSTFMFAVDEHERRDYLIWNKAKPQPASLRTRSTRCTIVIMEAPQSLSERKPVPRATRLAGRCFIPAAWPPERRGLSPARCTGPAVLRPPHVEEFGHSCCPVTSSPSCEVLARFRLHCLLGEKVPQLLGSSRASRKKFDFIVRLRQRVSAPQERKDRNRLGTGYTRLA